MTLTLKRASAVFLLFVAASLLAYSVFMVRTVDAAPSSVNIQTTATATTTVSYIGVGTATTTYQFDSAVFSSGKIANMQPVDRTALYLQVAASSTATVVVVTPQFSNNGIDWYNYGTATSSLSTNGASAIAVPTNYQWTPGTTATSSTVIILPEVPTQHERVVISTTGAAAAVYAEVDMKKNAGGSQ